MSEDVVLGRTEQQHLRLHRLRDQTLQEAEDQVAREDAMQLLVDGAPLAIMLRTPGMDLELALGLLHAEGVISRAGDVASARVAASGQTKLEHLPISLELDPEAENLVDVRLVRPLDGGPLGWQRALPSSSACGICGAATLEALLAVQPPVRGQAIWPISTILGLPDRLFQAQRVFHNTGGLHAAGLLRPGKSELWVCEDIGRHNAVDKLVGRALLEGILPLEDCCLIVSGRAGFEIVQKAAKAGITVVASISAPSSLAVQTAEVSGVTLVGFIRADHANVYTHPHRLREPLAQD